MSRFTDPEEAEARHEYLLDLAADVQEAAVAYERDTIELAQQWKDTHPNAH